MRTTDDEYYEVYGRDEEFDIDIYEDDESYENVYDMDGYEVYCDYCQWVIKKKDGLYICTGCGQVMDLDTFLNYIGVVLPD